MQQNPAEIKEKILRVIQLKGPNIPIRISKEINSSSLFTSAFLSELLSERKIKTSTLRVGSSPVYLIPGQEIQLERYTDNLKNKEKEAYLLLKNKKILKDSEQEPAIRVALRAIKDFSVPFKKDEEIYWRYFTLSEEETISILNKDIKKEIEIQKEEQIQIKPKEIIKKQEKDKRKLDIFDKEKIKQKNQRKKSMNKTSTKKEEKFFNKVKVFLSENSIELLNIEGFNKSSVILKVKKDSEELLLIAHDKKRITERDFLDANKKAQEFKLKYILLSLGEPTKKLFNFIEAIKNIESIKKIK